MNVDKEKKKGKLSYSAGRNKNQYRYFWKQSGILFPVINYPFAL